MRAREPSTTKSRIGIMTTKDFYVLAAPLPSNQELGQEPKRIVIKQPSFTPPRIEAEPERRLWKICAQAVPLRLGAVEWIALLLFGVSTICILACCVFEWLQLSNSGSLDQVGRALLSR
jgi:hypothetical protein